MSLRDTLASRRLVVLLSWNIACISLEKLSILAIRCQVLLRSSILMRRTSPTVIYDRLLAEANDVFEIICLGSISSLSHIAIDHKRTRTTPLHRRSKVELLWSLLQSTFAVIATTSCLMKIDEVSWCEVHVLHIIALALVSNILRWNLCRYLSLED